MEELRKQKKGLSQHTEKEETWKDPRLSQQADTRLTACAAYSVKDYAGAQTEPPESILYPWI